MAGGEEVVDGFATFGTALTNLWTYIRQVFEHLTGNEFFAVLIVASLVVIAFKLIKKAKRAARS